MYKDRNVNFSTAMNDRGIFFKVKFSDYWIFCPLVCFGQATEYIYIIFFVRFKTASLHDIILVYLEMSLKSERRLQEKS